MSPAELAHSLILDLYAQLNAANTEIARLRNELATSQPPVAAAE